MKQWLTAGIALLLIASTLNYRVEGSNGKVASDEYAVYSAILNRIKQSPSDGKRAKLLVVNNRTSGPLSRDLVDEVRKYEKELLSHHASSMIDDMLAKNRRAYPLSRRFNVTRDYVLLSAKRFSDFFKTKGALGWGDYYKRYPHGSGFNAFSRVGFNSSKTEAIVYTAVSCNVICGYYMFVLLNKEKGRWRIRWSTHPELMG